MDKRGKRQAASIFGSTGFYIALLVCVLAAGVVGYYALLNDGSAPDDDVITPVDQTEPPVVTPVVSPDDTESAAPVISEEPVVVPRPMPAPAEETAQVVENDPPQEIVPTVSDAPVTAQEPVVVVSPLAGETVAVFSVDQLTYDATLGDWRTHDGIDIQAAAGTEVVAAAAGTVVSVESDSRLGEVVVIDHNNGYVTTYASLQADPYVLPGDHVSAGMVIGTVGNTSLTEAGLGAHLHFSVSKDGVVIDPNEYLG